MNFLDHQIYEYKKGVRDLVLWTLPKDGEGEAVARLDRSGIPYLVQEVTESKVNLYFGSEGCVDIVRSFGGKPLNQYTHEEDFILGIMLGYSKEQQYRRYRERKQRLSAD